jgi:leucyl aminopeptidase
MIAKISKPTESKHCKAMIFVIDTQKSYSDLINSKAELDFLENELTREVNVSYIRTVNMLSVFVTIPAKEDKNEEREFVRRKASEAYALIKNNNFDEVEIKSNNDEFEGAFIEGLILSSYQFDKFKTEKEKYALKQVFASQYDDQLVNVLGSVFWARDLVNEPPAHQTPTALSKEFEEMAKNIEGLDIEVFNKIQIEALRMGGLLSVNRGSVQPPTFSVLSYNPKDAVNKKPIVMVGKGVVYDTGGINLKPTGYLETMKSDMSGAAVVSALIRAVASNKLPIYMVVLVPATDNRPGGDAYVPSDIVTMMGGKTVEVINTDAEGRMILADGLTYSEKYDPELVFSVATLTGSASMAFGSKSFVCMGNAKENIASLYKSGLEIGERCWEMPFWEDYGEELKSTIADLKHLGGRSAGAITAGKFLENFVSSPYIHLDIAGVSFMEKAEHYKPIGGTGTGIRALYKFIESFIAQKQSSN